MHRVQPTAPVLLADCVTTANGLKMASTGNHRYSIANFNFNLTVIRLQQLNILSRKRRNIAENKRVSTILRTQAGTVNSRA